MSKLAARASAPSRETEVFDPVPEPVPGFAARLRDATTAVHREAERTGFLADLVRGRGTRAGYLTFLRNLVPVYAALETALDARGETAVLSAFAQLGLRRLPSLLDDIKALAEDGDPAPAVLPEADAYAHAIAAAAEEDGVRLVAHAYARYLGDLSGGQILKPILARSLHLAPEALRFYDFPAIEHPEAAKAEMREALDRIPAAGPAADLVVNEAIAAFHHNIALSLAVARAVE